MEALTALLANCAGNSPVTGEFPAQRPVTRSFDVFVDLCLNKRLSKHSWGWWFEMPSGPLWRHSNGKQVGLSQHPISRACDIRRSGHYICVYWEWSLLIPISSLLCDSIIGLSQHPILRPHDIWRSYIWVNSERPFVIPVSSLFCDSPAIKGRGIV